MLAAVKIKTINYTDIENNNYSDLVKTDHYVQCICFDCLNSH